jgi:hypothetical protein
LKIISGGQTGVDRAALDVAWELGLEHGGWCPKGRLAEDGPIEDKYILVETPKKEYVQRTEWNVRDSDATLIITAGKPTGGTAYTIEIAKYIKKPCYVVDPSQPEATGDVREWIGREDVKVLNVAGPRESTLPGSYEGAKRLLLDVLR